MNNVIYYQTFTLIFVIPTELIMIFDSFGLLPVNHLPAQNKYVVMSRTERLNTCSYIPLDVWAYSVGLSSDQCK